MNSIDKNDDLTPWGNYLPEDWHCTRIDNVADVLFSNVDKRTFENEEPVHLCNYVDVYKNDRITRKIEFMEASADFREIKKFQIQRGDVLSTKDSEAPDDIAISALVDDDLPNVLCGYHLALMRPRSKRLHGPYLAWVHASKQFRAQYEARAVGVTRFGLPQYAFRSARLPLPPFAEQKRISAYLDASCSSIDAAIVAKSHQIMALKNMLFSIISKSTVQGLNQITTGYDTSWPWLQGVPRQWRYGHLKRYAKRIQAGVTPPTAKPEYYEDGVIPWFAPGSYDGDLELHSPRKLINEVALRDGALRMFPAGTIFFIGIGATIGKVGIVTKPSSCNQQIVGIVTNHDFLPRYLAYQMKTYEAIIPGISTATTLPIFDQVKTGYLPVVVPPRREQQTICEYLDAKTIGNVQKLWHGANPT